MFTDIINGLFADYDEGFHSTQAVTPERIAQVKQHSAILCLPATSPL